MTEILFGSRASIEETPALISLINCNSPLRWDDRMLEAQFEYSAANQPVVLTPFILMGAMSPVTIPAALVQQITEALSGIALSQLIRPGAPVVFGSFLSNIDMQSGSPTFGTPESGMGLLCTGQIARHFDLPFRTGGGLTSSQVPDAQAGYEALMTLLPTLPRRSQLGHALRGLARRRPGRGLREVHHRRRAGADAAARVHPARDRRGVDGVRRPQEVGHGGHFLGAAHTMERFRTCFYRPMLSSSENYERWMRNGAKDTATRAGEIYQKTLDEFEPPPIDDAVREELEAYVTRRRAELGD